MVSLRRRAKPSKTDDESRPQIVDPDFVDQHKSATASGRSKSPNRKINPTADLITESQVTAEVSLSRDALIRRRVVFIVGILLGIGATLFYVTYLVHSHDNPAFRFINEAVTDLLGDMDLSRFFEGKPFEQLVSFLKSTPSHEMDVSEFRIGQRLAREGLTAKHPVIIIPGFISSQLEVWNTVVPGSHKALNDSTSPGCVYKYFRQRLWGTLNNARALLLDKDCWLSHMTLDPHTGLDPPLFRLRAVQGLDATENLLPGFWVFSKLVSNLAALGADNNNIFLASYDWRLSYHNLERRDRYFTRLKTAIENCVLNDAESLDKQQGVVVVAHSMGNLLFLYFMNWIKSEMGHENGTAWLDANIHRYVNIAGPLLGVPKALPSILSGETGDSAQLNTFAAQIVDNFLSKDERAKLFRSWGCLWAMFPKGGDILWGTADNRAYDQPDANHTQYCNMLRVSYVDSGNSSSILRTANLGADDAIDLVINQAGEPFKRRFREELSPSIATSLSQIQSSATDRTTWANPLIAPLPAFKQKQFKIVCIYGSGLPTDRAYEYQAKVDCSSPTQPCNETHTTPTYMINVTAQNGDAGLNNGVQTSNGDGAVPLLSLGYMCAKGWREKRYNPSNIPIVTREYQNKLPPSIVAPIVRSPESVNHIDILGNDLVIEDILRVAAGEDEALGDLIVSDIQRISNLVKLPKL